MSFNEKIVSLSIGHQTTTNWKEKGETVVFTNGCFDLLHVGHIRYLAQAKKLGDFLIIGLNSDSSVKALKGKDRPINSFPRFFNF